MPYTTPADVATGDTLTQTLINNSIMENIRSLYARPSATATVRGASTNITSTSTTITAVDDAQFTLTLVTTGAALQLAFSGYISHSVANTAVLFDILIDDTNWASSLTNTAVTNNLWSPRPVTAATIVNVELAHVLPAGALAAGTHTFKLRWRAGAAGTITLATNGYVTQFRAREI